MLIQAAIFAWLYDLAFATQQGRPWAKAVAYGCAEFKHSHDLCVDGP
jgi:hypothetical protein